jgi:hypothetical protein
VRLCLLLVRGVQASCRNVLLPLTLLLLRPPPPTCPAGLSKLPNARKFNLGKYPSGTLRQRFPPAGLGFDGRPALSEQGFHLLSSLLELCPVSAPTPAQLAMFFWQLRGAASIAMLAHRPPLRLAVCVVGLPTPACVRSLPTFLLPAPTVCCAIIPARVLPPAVPLPACRSGASLVPTP